MPTKVIVVGGGLAGLVCARKMMDAGLDVMVLEGQTRPGGRIHTLRAFFADHMYCEAGAMGFLDIHTNVKELVSQLGLQANEFKSESSPTVFYLRGRRLLELPGKPAHDFAGLTDEERQLGVDGIYGKYVATPSKQLGDPLAPNWSPAPFQELDNILASDFLLKNGASPAAIQLLGCGLCGLYGDGVDSFSALMLLLGAALLQNAKSDFEIVNGNDNLPRVLAQTLGSSINYGAEVTSIEQNNYGVTVTYSRLAATRSIQADYAVCAMPFPRLMLINFSPSLPALIEEMIQNVGNTSVTRVFQQAQSRFWAKGPNASESIELAKNHALVLSAYNGPGTRGILEAYLAGQAARYADVLPETARLGEMLDFVRTTFPDADSECEGGQTWSWDKDVWAKGAYAFFRPGQFTKYWTSLTAPAGKIHFCGDQTSLWVGWMEGAVLSGNRAAQEVLDAAAKPGAAQASPVIPR
ncbi:MAG: FAD-dependent oxidoreductase [Bryobacterales bacterium]|nr:FAD-dependent oxidoreductase [Bryobacterales bacterium]